MRACCTRSVRRHASCADTSPRAPAYLALLGCALSIPAGLLPMYGLQRLANVSLEFVMPWREIGITLFVMPIVAYAGTWLVAFLRGGRRMRMPTAQVST